MIVSKFCNFVAVIARVFVLLCLGRSSKCKTLSEPGLIKLIMQMNQCVTLGVQTHDFLTLPGTSHVCLTKNLTLTHFFFLAGQPTYRSSALQRFHPPAPFSQPTGPHH